jgi:hypothetical protein
MTFEEALKKKKEFGESYLHSDLVYDVFIVPKKDKDFDDYCKDLLTNAFSLDSLIFKDEDAKKYCSDNQFRICGIKVVEQCVLNIKL